MLATHSPPQRGYGGPNKETKQWLKKHSKKKWW